MVLDPRDSTGPSPLLKGVPLDLWTKVEQKWAMEDAFDKCMQQQGPRYTRQVIRGDRLDQARLDRIYISKDATWCNEGWGLSPDPVVAWELSWGRVRELFTEFRLEDRAKISSLKEKQDRLGDIRENLTKNSTAEELDTYGRLEKEVRETELLEAKNFKKKKPDSVDTEG
ncbi:hypothetical protein R1sor_004349 [Riccia sorocarpa]|uniref:Transposase n=1 Tax=Riccia sorocarpa TaxID=122646 RepID=A0ABD3HH25_9MARC